MVDRQKHAFEVAQKDQMILSDKRLLEKISSAQRDIRNKEKILKQFKEEAGYVGGS